MACWSGALPASAFPSMAPSNSLGCSQSASGTSLEPGISQNLIIFLNLAQVSQVDTQPSLALPHTQGEMLILKKRDWKLPAGLIPSWEEPPSPPAPGMHQPLQSCFGISSAALLTKPCRWSICWSPEPPAYLTDPKCLIFSSVFTLSVCLSTASSWLDSDCKPFDREISLCLHLFFQQEQNPLYLWPG